MILLRHQLAVLLDLLAENHDLISVFPQILSIYSRELLLFSKRLIHSQESLRILTLCLVYRRELVS